MPAKTMNPKLSLLQPYPFQKLAELTRGVDRPSTLSHICLSIGEPKHAAPDFVAAETLDNIAGLSVYPTTKGTAALRETIASWCDRRYGLGSKPLDPERQVLPTSGSREALFSLAQAIVDGSSNTRPIVMMPNPFYQIYEGAALLASAEPYYLATPAHTGFLPNFGEVPASVWERTQLLYVCSPGNPTGAVLGLEQWREVLELSARYDFVVVSDECYSEIYFDEEQPPLGLLGAAHALGIDDYERCIIAQSLSKRSNLPGLRSGFVAGDARIMERYQLYRTYHGCTVPTVTQAVSVAAWSDEDHVHASRELYRRKFDAVLDILEPVLDVNRPAAGFYLWPCTPVDDEQFTRGLLAEQNVAVLPGRYLSRPAGGIDPGARRVRMALVAPQAECVDAAHRIAAYVNALAA
jgi:N-succinyldiaminopimelate aminotransferase